MRSKKAQKFACLDVTAGRRSMDLTWVDLGDCRVHHRQIRDLPTLLECLDRERPDVFAVDAPSKPNIGRAKIREVRSRYDLKGLPVDRRLASDHLSGWQTIRRLRQPETAVDA